MCDNGACDIPPIACDGIIALQYNANREPPGVQHVHDDVEQRRLRLGRPITVGTECVSFSVAPASPAQSTPLD